MDGISAKTNNEELKIWIEKIQDGYIYHSIHTFTDGRPEIVTERKIMSLSELLIG